MLEKWYIDEVQVNTEKVLFECNKEWFMTTTEVLAKRDYTWNNRTPVLSNTLIR